MPKTHTVKTRQNLDPGPLLFPQVREGERMVEWPRGTAAEAVTAAEPGEDTDLGAASPPSPRGAPPEDPLGAGTVLRAGGQRESMLLASGMSQVTGDGGGHRRNVEQA